MICKHCRKPGRSDEEDMIVDDVVIVHALDSSTVVVVGVVV